LAKIDAYALSAQSAYLAGETDFLTRHPFGSWVYPEDAVSAADEAPAPPERIFPFSSPTYLDLLHTHFYAERLSYANPVLHHLCRLCLDESERAFPQKWEAASATFLKDHADYIPYYASLFAYYLCQYFLRTFEDYSFRRNIRSGLIYINMKFFFDALFSQEKGGFDDECFAAVLSAYSKRAFFSEEILDEMYTALEKRKATL
ncbi:MAG: hypothetical protein IKS87_09340, partial [Lachnospiraceae bacterium]|nr:hypothetical protein [Lachnospiraceae bacterium]